MGVQPVDGFRFVGQRRRLIERIRDAGITDLALLELFDRVPRHLFLPEGVWNRAYDDAPVPIGFGQTASQPSLQAMMLAALDPRPTDVVLEIGTGSGFLTALLARLADRVYSVERERALSQRARTALDQLEIRNVALLVGDGTIGWRKYAPFDVIVVSAGAPTVPEALIEQLAEGGRMLIPVGDRDEQRLMLVRRVEGQILQEDARIPCRFVPLIGKFGWSKELDT
ncbi:MAG: protein-L-isoaspartate(D-aspartate) O-methyltransferase [Gemmatimonadota bacterium]